eukprot:7381942-Prymnesium_polylepis.1
MVSWPPSKLLPCGATATTSPPARTEESNHRLALLPHAPRWLASPSAACRPPPWRRSVAHEPSTAGQHLIGEPLRSIYLVALSIGIESVHVPRRESPSHNRTFGGLRSRLVTYIVGTAGSRSAPLSNACKSIFDRPHRFPPPDLSRWRIADGRAGRGVASVRSVGRAEYMTADTGYFTHP